MSHRSRKTKVQNDFKMSHNLYFLCCKITHSLNELNFLAYALVIKFVEFVQHLVGKCISSLNPRTKVVNLCPWGPRKTSMCYLLPSNAVHYYIWEKLSNSIPKVPSYTHQYPQMGPKFLQSENFESNTDWGRSLISQLSVEIARLYSSQHHPARSLSSADADLRTSQLTIQQIPNNLVYMFAYKIKRVQQFQPQHYYQKADISQSCKDNISSASDFFRWIAYSDACAFHVSEIADSQKTRIWEQKSQERFKNMNLTVTKSL